MKNDKDKEAVSSPAPATHTVRMTLRQLMRLAGRVKAVIDGIEVRVVAAEKRAATLETEVHAGKLKAIRREQEVHRLRESFEELGKRTHRLGGFYYHLREGFAVVAETHGIDPDAPFTVTIPDDVQRIIEDKD